MRKVPGLFLPLLVASAAGAAEQECDGVFLHFSSHGEVREQDTLFYLREQLLLNQDTLFQYDKTLQVLGSKADSAVDSSLNYQRLFPGQPGPRTEEVLALAQRLKALGIFALYSDPVVPEASAHQIELSFRADCQETQLSFATREVSAERGRVMAEIRAFFDEQAARAPLEREERLSQGDQRQATPVSIAELLATPERYDGQRVRTHGVFSRGYESSALSDSGQSLWLDRGSAMAQDTTPIEPLQGRAVTVEGIFFAGPSGHLGGYPGEIARLTRIVARQAPGHRQLRSHQIDQAQPAQSATKKPGHRARKVLPP